MMAGDPFYIQRQCLKSGFRRAREAAGMDHIHIHIHDRRHSTASLLAHAGVDLHTISKTLGHSTTRMSERYAHIKTGKQSDALEKVFGGK
jgi:site-specific recombinase XerD